MQATKNNYSYIVYYFLIPQEIIPLSLEREGVYIISSCGTPDP